MAAEGPDPARPAGSAVPPRSSDVTAKVATTATATSAAASPARIPGPIARAGTTVAGPGGRESTGPGGTASAGPGPGGGTARGTKGTRPVVTYADSSRSASAAPSRRSGSRSSSPRTTGSSGPACAAWPDVGVDDGVQDPAERVPVERRLPGQRRAQQHAERPEVGGRTGRRALHPLGRGVLGRADERAGLADRGDPGQVGDAEVREHHPARAGLHQDVRRFDVPVQHASRVRRAERAQQCETGPRRLLHAQRAFGGKPVGERAAVDEFHHDVRAALVFHHVVDHDDVRVPDLRDRTGFPQGAAGLAAAVEVQLLDGDGPAEQLVLGPPHRPHPTPPQPLVQAVTPADHSTVARLALRHVLPLDPSTAMMPHRQPSGGSGGAAVVSVMCRWPSVSCQRCLEPWGGPAGCPSGRRFKRGIPHA